MKKSAYYPIILFCIVELLILLLNPSIGYAYAAPDVSAVFSEDEANRIWDIARSKPIVPDKADTDDTNTIGLLSSYPIRKGVILITGDKYKNLIPSGHAAIIYSSSEVVESLENGVVLGKNNWNSSHGTVTGLSVNRTSAFQDAKAADWCYSQRGKPYNFNFFDKYTRSSFYCSQLVWAAYFDLHGVDLDTPAFGSAVYPGELAASSYTNTIYIK